VEWSKGIALHGPEIDPIREMLRQQRYRKLADEAAVILNGLKLGTYEWHYLLAQVFTNKWEYDVARRHIDQAIDLLPRDSYLVASYYRLRDVIRGRREKYS
jgi:hypothetical protein